MTAVAAAAADLPTRMQTLVDTILAYRFRYCGERDLQDGLARVFDAAGLEVDREVRLSPRERIDFLAGDIGLEVKVAGRPSALARQLMRYALDPRIAGLVLVTDRTQFAALRLPPMFNGKPLTVVALYGGLR